MSEETVQPARRKIRSKRRYRYLWALAALIGLSATTLAFLSLVRRTRQQQDDPRVATVWVTGVTHGPDLTLRHGNAVIAWLNAHGIHALGESEQILSRYSGNPDGVEIWFAYRSHLSGQKELECHRVGRTGFVDDLGQEYHGFLDFSGSYVGVYLPAYDHAAHRLTCTLHWMPRAPARPTPVSHPMRFTIDLPPTHRVLPTPDRLASGPVTQTRNGITVTLSDARLSAPLLSAYSSPQRHLTFHLDIKGGVLADINTEPYLLTQVASDQAYSKQTYGKGAIKSNLSIMDPYGVSLVPERDVIAPDRGSRSRDWPPINPTSATWIVPVNGAGVGTDVVRLHFDIQPTAGGALVSFDPSVKCRQQKSRQ